MGDGGLLDLAAELCEHGVVGVVINVVLVVVVVVVVELGLLLLVVMVLGRKWRRRGLIRVVGRYRRAVERTVHVTCLN